MTLLEDDTTTRSPRDASPGSRRDASVSTLEGRPVGAGRPRRQTSPPGDDSSAGPAVGVAEVREESPVDRDDSTGGGGSDVNGGGPTEPPRRGRHRYRPDPPPRWMRLALYGMMMVVAFLLGYLCGKVWARIDKAVWVDQPLWGL